MRKQFSHIVFFVQLSLCCLMSFGCSYRLQPLLPVSSLQQPTKPSASQMVQPTILTLPSQTPTEPSQETQEDTARAPSSPAEIADSAVKSTPDSENWNIHLVNLHHPLPDDYLPDLAPVPVVFAIDQATTYYLDFRVIDALQEMLSSSAEASLPIYVTSAFRTRSYQQTLYENEVQYYRNQGYSEEEAIVLGGSYVAYPGTSEHQLGLAVDLVSPDHYWLDESFEQTMAFAWLTEHAMEYGFVLRYPKDKTELTGIAYEPWHYRYVGPNHALSMKELSLCLEEYLETLDLP